MNTQGKTICKHLKRQWMTYRDMLMLGISTVPHKRVVESLHHFPGYGLVKRKNGRGLVEWRLIRVPAAS